MRLDRVTRTSGRRYRWWQQLASKLVTSAIFLVVAVGSSAAEPYAGWPRTDFKKTTVPLEEIISGGPPKDGIPSIDRPKFVDYAAADAWLHPQEPVIAVEVGRQARAYPLQILMYHEIVNDSIAGVPLAVTFCPLCNASIVYDRRVGTATLDFGTTGRLRKSDLVMYDRQTESWWQQFTGGAIVGHHAGASLKQVPAQVVAYVDFKTAFPRGTVLSRDTGYSRPYGRNPYRGYDRVGQNPFLFRDPVDPRLPAMERVLGLTVGGKSKVYPFSALERTPVVNDRIDSQPIVVISKPGMLSVLDNEAISSSRAIAAAAGYSAEVRGKTLSFDHRDGAIVDRETGTHWDLLGRAIAGPLRGERLAPIEGGVHFAFAWLAFSPDSVVYGTQDRRP